MDFTIEISEVPGSIREFSTGGYRAGDPAIKVTYDGVNWGTSQYTKPLEDSGLKDVKTYTIAGLSMEFAETTSKADITGVDGTVTERVDATLAYYSEDKLDSLGDGDGTRLMPLFTSGRSIRRDRLYDMWKAQRR